jgi:hypothetical protein
MASKKKRIERLEMLVEAMQSDIEGLKNGYVATWQPTLGRTDTINQGICFGCGYPVQDGLAHSCPATSRDSRSWGSITVPPDVIPTEAK